MERHAGRLGPEFPSGRRAQVRLFSPSGMQVGTFDAEGSQQFNLSETGTFVIQVGAAYRVQTGCCEIGLITPLRKGRPPPPEARPAHFRSAGGSRELVGADSYSIGVVMRTPNHSTAMRLDVVKSSDLRVAP